LKLTRNVEAILHFENSVPRCVDIPESNPPNEVRRRVTGLHHIDKIAFAVCEVKARFHEIFWVQQYSISYRVCGFLASLARPGCFVRSAAPKC
jgi:hypothetical protein